MSRATKPFYVSNIRLFDEYLKWYASIEEAKSQGKEEPEIPRFIAESIMKICNRLSYAPNFINYSYREEFVGDAIENVIKTAKNFNPERSSNPFSFITTIAYNAFLRRIAIEKKQSYVKSEIIKELPLEDLLDVQDHDDDCMVHNQMLDFLRENSFLDNDYTPKRKKRKTVALHEETLFPIEVDIE